MSILDEIIADKKKHVEKVRGLYPIKLFEESEHYDAPCVQLTKYLTRPDKLGIIAEIKRRSPSKGTFKENISVEQLSIGYMQAGASGLSVLTDKKYFGGVNEDVRIARRYNYCPILRKDFVVDEYQIFEAKAIGADVVLLIASVLNSEQIALFSERAHELGLEVMLEVHSKEEIDRSPIERVDLVGINNRNLKTFEVSIDTSLELVEKLPADIVKISESGISTASTIHTLKTAGFSGFLIGETFMSTPDPAEACQKLIRAVAELEGSAGDTD